jgi:hypothetical protein
MQLSGMSQCSTLFGDEFTDWLNTIALIPHKSTKEDVKTVEAAFRGLEKVLGPVSKTTGHPRPPSNRYSPQGGLRMSRQWIPTIQNKDQFGSSSEVNGRKLTTTIWTVMNA